MIIRRSAALLAVLLLVVSCSSAEPPPPTAAPVSTPADDPAPSAESDDGEFCRRWGIYLEFAREDSGGEVDETNATIIVMHFNSLAEVAPAELLDHVDLVIDVYTTFATAPEPYQVPLSGLQASGLADAFYAIDDFCGTGVFPNPG